MLGLVAPGSDWRLASTSAVSGANQQKVKDIPKTAAFVWGLWTSRDFSSIHSSGQGKLFVKNSC